MALAREARETVAQLDRSILVETETLQSHVNGSLTGERLLALLSGLLGGVSLLLVAIGLHGVLAYSVARRTREIGIRMALGARPTSVAAMIFREGLLLVLIGSVIGGLAALACSQLVASLLFRVTTRDAFAFAAAVLAIGLATSLATLFPALRATRLDPVAALRYE
jgi:ABC-type antimicrobial peptide transport system permease subunit